MTSIRALLTLSSIGLAMVAWHAQAQTIPPEGPVSVTYTATQIPPPKPMPIGGGKEYAVINQAMTASNDRGNPILNNMAGRCQFSRLVDTAAKTVELHGYCTYADNDGDQIFEQCDFVPGAPNNCKLTGGTGKFQGLEASLVITASPVKSNYDGIAQVIGQKKGTYRIVKAQ
jgi:hypothetical protein